MSKRFGKKRVPECRCTTSLTCGPCLVAGMILAPPSGKATDPRRPEADCVLDAVGTCMYHHVNHEEGG